MTHATCSVHRRAMEELKKKMSRAFIFRTQGFSFIFRWVASLYVSGRPFFFWDGPQKIGQIHDVMGVLRLSITQAQTLRESTTHQFPDF